LIAAATYYLTTTGEINKEMNFDHYWRAIKRRYQSKVSSSKKNNRLRELKMGASFYDYTHTFSNLGREVSILDTLKCDLYRECLRSWLKTKLEAYQETDFDGLVEHTKLIYDRHVLNNRNKTIINSKVQQETSRKKLIMNCTLCGRKGHTFQYCYDNPNKRKDSRKQDASHHVNALEETKGTNSDDCDSWTDREMEESSADEENSEKVNALQSIAVENFTCSINTLKIQAWKIIIRETVLENALLCSSDRRLEVQLLINSSFEKVTAILDTGATTSILGRRFAKQSSGVCCAIGKQFSNDKIILF
jgi:hypothetical protein